MAANCRRLCTRVLSKYWSSSACRLHQRAYVTTTLSTREPPCLRVPLVASPLRVCQQHGMATKTLESPEPVETAGIFSRFWAWLHDDGSEEPMREEERLEREALLQKVQDMYFAKPPITPGLDFYKEVFSTLMKFDDSLGVQTLWNFMREMNVDPDEELKSTVEPFLVEARRNSWFE